MDSYSDALHAMHDLLGVLGESHWRNWIAQDISQWEDRRSTSHHLAAYGGMASFKDIGSEDIWLGSLFDDLKSACYFFARRSRGKPDIEALLNSMGSLGIEISGWRCLACGYGAVSQRDIDYFVARRVVREAVLEAARDTQLSNLVRKIVERAPSNDTASNATVTEWVKDGGINIRSSNDWMRPCPVCKSDETAVCRWRFTNQGGDRFVASNDNLPLRSQAESPK